MRKVMKILLFTSVFFMFAGGMFGPIYAVFVKNIGGDLLTAGGAYAAFSIAAGILLLLLGKWEDRIKHKEKLVILGYGLSCLGFLGYLFIQETIHLFIVQIIFGIGEAINSPAYDAIYSRLLERGKFASQWGIWEGLQYIVVAVAALVGGYLASLYGFRFIFMIMFGLSVVGLISSSLLLRKR